MPAVVDSVATAVARSRFVALRERVGGDSNRVTRSRLESNWKRLWTYQNPGRIDYSQPADTEGFLKAGVPLLDWAVRHMTCCRKAARRIYALVVLDRIDKATQEAHYRIAGYNSIHIPRTAQRRPHPCCDELRHALAVMQAHMSSTFPAWDERDTPKRPWILDVQDHLLYVRKRPNRNWSKEQKHLSRLDSKWWITFDWPTYVDPALPTEEKLTQAWEYLQVRNRAFGRLRFEYTFPSSSLLDDRHGQEVTDQANVLYERLWPSIEPLAAALVEKAVGVHDFFSSGHRDDLLQEARLAVYRAIEKYEGLAAFSTFAYSVIWNALVDYMKHESRWDGHVADRPVNEDPPSTTWDPPTLIDGWCDLMTLLRHTPGSDLLLMHAAGYSDRELLPRHGSHTKMKRFRARKALERGLSSQGERLEL
jgi:DNA-directed RNA polymerase specialized sigma24 family protein